MCCIVASTNLCTCRWPFVHRAQARRLILTHDHDIYLARRLLYNFRSGRNDSQVAPLSTQHMFIRIMMIRLDDDYRCCFVCAQWTGSRESTGVRRRHSFAARRSDDVQAICVHVVCIYVTHAHTFTHIHIALQ